MESTEFKNQIEEDLRHYDYQMALKNNKVNLNKDSGVNLRTHLNSSEGRKMLIKDHSARANVKRVNANNQRFVTKLRKEFDHIRSVEDDKNFQLYRKDHSKTVSPTFSPVEEVYMPPQTSDGAAGQYFGKPHKS